MVTQNVELPSVTSPNLTLGQVEERLFHHLKKGHTDSYQIGLLYNYVVDSNLAVTGGFTDTQDFFKQRVAVLSQSTLSMCGAIARKFSEAATVQYGISKLYLLLTYAKHAKVEVDGSAPGLTPISVPQDNGTLATKAFAECGRDELQLAVKGQRAGASALPDEDVAHLKRLQERLDRHLPQKHGIRVEARVSAGKLRVSLRNVPAAQVERLVAVLVSPPAPELAAPSQPVTAMPATPPQPQPQQAVAPPVPSMTPQPPQAVAPPVQSMTPQPQAQAGATLQVQGGPPPAQAMAPGRPRSLRAGLFGMLREAFQPLPRPGA